MGIQQQDPEYLRAKSAFIRDLISFHDSRSSGLSCDPKINGKEVDLYLLYQIVTSHGGWEKINLRNEWDKLLEHFRLPRSTNGGLAIKQIYLRYLELYEKIHYLGEDVDTKDEPEDDYLEDFRGRRRYPNKLASHSSHHSSHHHPPKEIADHNRSQLGLSSRLLESSDYEGLLLSLQSPLPNEQDTGISVCTLLSNETKHVLKFSKGPAILTMLLAHAGIFEDCSTRLLMEETYKEGREMDYSAFWDEVLHHPEARELLCECFVKKLNLNLGLTEDEGAIMSQIKELEDGDLPEEEKYALGIALQLRLTRLRESRMDTSVAALDDEETCTPTVEPVDKTDQPETASTEETPVEKEKEEEEAQPQNDTPLCNGVDALKDSIKCPETYPVKTENDDLVSVQSEPEPCYTWCCSSCPCRRDFGEAEKEISMPCTERSIPENSETSMEENREGPASNIPFTLARANKSCEKVGQRISQIAHILRNLSFEQDNAILMAGNPTLMRFLLVAANSKYGTLSQTAFDIIGNISSYIRLDEPLQDPITSHFLTLLTTGVFATDRFKILRSLEALRELAKVDGNELVIGRYFEQNVYRRMCDLLTLSDIMLLIYTLECILSMTGLGDAVCDEIVRVQGSVATLVSLVTVEAQSYGPKGCILMRVVETVTGSASAGPSTATVPTVCATSNQSTPAHHTMQSIHHQTTPMVAVAQSPHTVVHSVPQSQHLLQQVLQQPPNPIYAPSASGSTTPCRPSPASSPGIKMVSGTTTIVPPVAQGQVALQPVTYVKPSSPIPQLANTPSVSSSGQVFNTVPSTNLLNHLNSAVQPQQYLQAQPQHVVAAMALPPSAVVLPQQSSALPANRVQIAGVANETNAAHLPPSGATVVVQQQKVPQGSVVVPPPPGAHIVANTTVNGAQTPCLVTGNLPQISNHSLNQHHVVTPSISLVTPRGTLSEEAWAIAWLKGTFESACGTSIEQGEIYRMYSAARKNPNVVLSLEQFVQCVKCAYGANVGPVIKQFGGGTSLPFFEGIKPKIAIRAIVNASPTSNSAPIKVACPPPNPSLPAAIPVQITPSTTSLPAPISNVPVLQTNPVLATPDGMPVIHQDGEQSVMQESNCGSVNSTTNNGGGITATLPVSVHIPSRDAKPSLSPILQATLSQPPKAKTGIVANNNATTGTKRAKIHKPGKDSKKRSKGKKGDTSSEELLEDLVADVASANQTTTSKGKCAFSPASSVIRSLLASKVVQRQQNKLQQQVPKSKLGDQLNSNSIEDGLCSSPEIVKVNGVGPETGLEKLEESSASSSVLSSDGSDNSAKASLTSFHGVLHNGQVNSDSMEAFDDPEALAKKGSVKGMLIDLLERKTPAREPVNGIMTGREIRISDKGLELIEKMEETVVASGGDVETTANHTNSNSVVSGSSTCNNDVQESQKMTFYSSTSDAQVTLQGQAPSTACVVPAAAVGSVLSGSAVTLASGGGEGVSSLPTASNNVPLTLRTASGQQLAGLKRPSSPTKTSTATNINNNNNNSSMEVDDMPPPAKKMAVDSNVMSISQSNTAASLPVPIPVANSAGSAPAIPTSLPNNLAATTDQSVVTTATTTVVPVSGTTPSLPPGSGAQVVQLPLRLSVNPQNPQQLTFTRQLVLPTGQQLLLAGNSQSPLQGQVIISKQQGSTNDQMPKAIIILQQQQGAAGGTSTPQTVVSTASIQTIQTQSTVASQQTMVVTNTVGQQQSSTMHSGTTQVVAVQQHPAGNVARLQVPSGAIVQQAQSPMVHQVVSAPLHHAAVQQQPQQLQLHVPHPSSAQVQALVAAKQQAATQLQFEGIHSSSFPHLSQDQLDLEFPFLCEWSNCGLRFLRPQQVNMHALKVHCPETLVDAVKCEWGQNGCDPLLRKRFSLMTHLQDRHCSKQALEMALYRRKNKIEPPPVPQQPIHHPGYAPNAAFHAIKRHAMSFMSTKEHLHDDNEGPVTKSIRLTSALILRNLVNFSSLGRRMLQGYESHLSAIAMSNVESSRTIAQLLHDMNDQPKSSK